MNIINNRLITSLYKYTPGDVVQLGDEDCTILGRVPTTQLSYIITYSRGTLVNEYLHVTKCEAIDKQNVRNYTGKVYLVDEGYLTSSTHSTTWVKTDSNGFEEGKYYRVIYKPNIVYITKIVRGGNCCHLKIQNETSAYFPTGTFWNNLSFAESIIVEATIAEQDWLDRCITTRRAEPKDRIETDNNGLIAGEYYLIKHTTGRYIVLLEKDYSTYLYEPDRGGTSFQTKSFMFWNNTLVSRYLTRLATSDEKEWLDQCIKNNRLIRRAWVGAYLQAKIDQPQGTDLKIGDYLPVESLTREGGIGTFNDHSWTFTTDQLDKSWSLMTYGFKPPKVETNLQKIMSDLTPKVGDWVTITRSHKNWAPGMNQWVGRTLKIDRIKSDGTTYFKNLPPKLQGGWIWRFSDKHYRKATLTEVTHAQRCFAPTIGSNSLLLETFSSTITKAQKSRGKIKLIGNIDTPVYVAIKPTKYTKMSKYYLHSNKS